VARPCESGSCDARRSSRETALNDRTNMNRIIYIVGLIVVVLFVLGFLGLR